MKLLTKLWIVWLQLMMRDTVSETRLNNLMSEINDKVYKEGADQ